MTSELQKRQESEKRAAGYTTPDELAEASDQELVSVEGIGDCKLAEIRGLGT
jgi:DNA integrity scanning protein DisA with diadenylate cyclase activity